MESLVLILIAHFLNNSADSLIEHDNAYAANPINNSYLYAFIYRKLSFIMAILSVIVLIYKIAIGGIV